MGMKPSPTVIYLASSFDFTREEAEAQTFVWWNEGRLVGELGKVEMFKEPMSYNEIIRCRARLRGER